MPDVATPTVYLTFDDGPHPTITPFILEQLALFHAKATFFCIGKNVTEHPGVFQRLLAEGHVVGNHTHNHLNGWKTDNHTYIKNIRLAAAHISSRLFRPPYGRIRMSQVRMLSRPARPWAIYMWDILSGDFDTELSPEDCLANVLKHITPGSIIVFHDSDKAWQRMSYALPQVLQFCKERNWAMSALPVS
jgi:peptidoglycan/xylan/chitin deacetylase (PgdA/CDA1 family)